MRPGLPHDAGGVQGRAPGVVVLAGVTGPLVEEVAAELHGVADGAAEEVADRPAEELALDVEGSDVEGGQDAVSRAGTGDHAAHAVAALDGVLLQCPGNPAAQFVDVEDVGAGKGRGREPGAGPGGRRRRRFRPKPDTPASVWTSTMARSANGS